jgi:hypothetical protein
MPKFPSTQAQVISPIKVGPSCLINAGQTMSL